MIRMIEDRAPGKDGTPAGYKQVKLDQQLFDLDADLGETTDVAKAHPAPRSAAVSKNVLPFI